MLMTTCETQIKHSDVPAATVNRDFVIGQLLESLQQVTLILEGKWVPEDKDVTSRYGDLIAALESFDQMIVINTKQYDDKAIRSSWEEFLESIVSGAALVADSDNTRLERRQRIVMECNNVRQA